MSVISKSYDFYRSFYTDKSTTGVIAATDSDPVTDAITPRNTNYTIHVQRIMLSVTTDAAQSLTFQDDAGSPVVIAKSAASPGLGIEVVADFGPAGIPLTEGKNLDIILSDDGLAGVYYIEAYEKLTADNVAATSA